MRGHIADYPVFDVSLVAGQRDYLGRKSDFSSLLIRSIAATARAAQAVVSSFHPTPPGRLHFTLRAVYGDRSPAFPNRTQRADRRRRYAQVTDWVQKERHRSTALISRLRLLPYRSGPAYASLQTPRAAAFPALAAQRAAL